MKSMAVSDLSLILSFALVLVSVAISWKEKLGLTKDIFYSVGRAIVQLVIVGYVLKFIMQVNNAILTLLMTLFIIFNAAWNANSGSQSWPS